MANADSTAELFLSAFRALSKEDRQAVLTGIAEDDQFGDDLVDLAHLVDRRDEPFRLFRDYLAEKKK